MSDEELSTAKNARYKRLKSLEWLAYGVGAVAWTVFGAAMWNPGEHWSRGARHGWMVGSWLVFAAFGLSRLFLMRKRSEMSPLPSPSALSTLDLSQRLAGPTAPISSDHWNGE